MIGKILLNEGPNNEFAQRIVLRLIGQGQPEIMHVLQKLFPNSPAMRVRSVADDLSASRDNAEGEFMGLVESDEVEIKIFEALSSADIDPELIMARSTFEPTKFNLTLTCARTPFKEFFDECNEITCESCIQDRITTFTTENPLSLKPWIIKIDRVEQRRLDICKNCGQILTKKSQINMQNERLLYKCDYCGHKGWTKAK